MKKTCLNLLAAMYLIASAGCHNNSKGSTVQAETKPPPDNVKQVLCPLHTAVDDVKAFAKLCQDSLGTVPIKAFTIRSEDLLAALNLPTSLVDSVYNGDTVCHHVRVYLGYRVAGEGTGFKLFIVPVKGANLSGNDTSWRAGIDIMLNSSGGPITHASKKSAAGDEYVLDLIAPCPKTCPEGSPLNP